MARERVFGFLVIIAGNQHAPHVLDNGADALGVVGARCGRTDQRQGEQSEGKDKGSLCCVQVCQVHRQPHWLVGAPGAPALCRHFDRQPQQKAALTLRQRRRGETVDESINRAGMNPSAGFEQALLATIAYDGMSRFVVAKRRLAIRIAEPARALRQGVEPLLVARYVLRQELGGDRSGVGVSVGVIAVVDDRQLLMALDLLPRSARPIVGAHAALNGGAVVGIEVGLGQLRGGEQKRQTLFGRVPIGAIGGGQMGDKVGTVGAQPTGERRVKHRAILNAGVEEVDGVGAVAPQDGDGVVEESWSAVVEGDEHRRAAIVAALHVAQGAEVESRLVQRLQLRGEHVRGVVEVVAGVKRAGGVADLMVDEHQGGVGQQPMQQRLGQADALHRFGAIDRAQQIAKHGGPSSQGVGVGPI
ncbi:hypothetical protein MAIT1_02425 [Magnetofaba australis IT-1]|uniref:Uncharacterized protein n=1 Tax=Magnetofaba australis IT-1 TaxID=1434232 RepID=A0A1Y2K3U1_9PROT|nr:hypothetical protein MAIT1_02425 [Magnetofaba australis IT-1]